MTDAEVSALLSTARRSPKRVSTPSESCPLVSGRLVRCLSLALDAVRTGTMIYAENGVQAPCLRGADLPRLPRFPSRCPRKAAWFQDSSQHVW